MVFFINRMVLTALILGSIAGCAAQTVTPITTEDLEATTCSKYVCKTSQQVFTPNTCVYYEAASNTFYCKDPGCATGENCRPAGRLSNYTCMPAWGSTALIGEYCASNSDCASPWSTTCTNNVCLPTNADSCITDEYRDDKWCPGGQFCNETTTYWPCKDEDGKFKWCRNSTATCIQQVGLGEQCWEDNDCANNLGCNINPGAAHNGTCVPYLSIKSGERVEYCYLPDEVIYDQNLLCESTLCGRVNGQKVCLDAVKSDGDLPVKCTILGKYSNECLTEKDSVSGRQLNNSCTCGLNKFGDAYCALSPGDSYFQSYLKYTKEWLSSPGIFKCNAEGRFDYLCMKAHWDEKKVQAWRYYNLFAKSYPSIANADDCVLSSFGIDYMRAKDAYDSSTDFLESAFA